MTRESADLDDLAVFISLEFADTRAEDLRADKSGDTADHVDRAGACEIVEADLAEPATAPDPVRFDRVDDRGDHARVYAVGQKLCTLRHSARNDRSGCSAEYEVEYKAGEVEVCV